MRSSAALGIVMVACLWLAAPAVADCAMGSSALSSFKGPDLAERSYIWTASVFEPLYLDTYAPLDYTAPVTPRRTASFWAAGSADSATGAGNDNGSFDLVAAMDLRYATDPDYGVFFAAELDTDWSDPTTDGCNGPNACTCLLLSDQDPSGRAGFFAAVAAKSDGLGDTSFFLAGQDPVGHGLPIVLERIPFPDVTAVSKPQADTLEITVALPAPAAGIYEAESGAGCSCDPVGYSIHGQVVTPAASWVPPDDRDPGVWTLLSAGITALDQPVTVSIVCPTPASQRVYLAAQLHFEGGFATTVVSSNSIPLECVDGSNPIDTVSARHPGTRRDSRRKTAAP